MMRGKQSLLWAAAAALTVGVTVLAFLPASWLGLLLEKQSGGKLALGDPQGSLWRGSAYIGAAPGKNDPLTPLLPGRFSWRLSPSILWGSIEMQLENPECMGQPLQMTGGIDAWRLGPGHLLLPADGLSALGAPLNTVGLSGRMELRWQELRFARQGAQLDLHGEIQMTLNEVASRMSFVKPLGDYNLRFNWQGQQAQMELRTLKGPLLLSGQGAIQQARLQFSGKAQAEDGKEEKLANLLRLLGQIRREGGKDYIALEYR
ncbi:type II secretion system protein N [Massilia sp. W12]|uniref:type II secretion system protein N n=1 Tax=Massilia sp. W12 TaxID=3126507 RepID=UPI0030D2D388